MEFFRCSRRGQPRTRVNTVRGQSIIELLLAVAISLIILPAIFGLFFASREGKPQARLRAQAIGLLTEAAEAVRNIREIGWDEFSDFEIGTAYHPVRDGNAWTLAPGSETIFSFTREIVIESFYRDGILDPSSRSVLVRVSWANPLPSVLEDTMILTRHDDILLIDTTDIDFNAGILTNTAVVKLSDGEVILGSTGGRGDWCAPNLGISSDLPKSGVANAISAIQGQIAAGTGENASGVSYANVAVSDPQFPTNPIASVSGAFDGYKTNEVFTEANFAYLATDNNFKEVVIVNLSSVDANGKYSEAGSFNAPGNGNGNAVAISGNVGYMLSANKLYSFDLSSKDGSRSILDPDGVTLPGSGNRLAVVGNRVFIATEQTNAQLAIVNINDPQNLILEDQISLPAGGATALYVNASATRAYVATHASAVQQEFFIVNVEKGSSEYKQVYGSYDTGGMDPKGVVVVSGPRAIVVGIGSEEYQVVDIANENTSPLPHCGGLEINSGVRGVSTVFTAANRAYSYIVTGDSSSELKIIEGGPGGGNDYILAGSFDSRVLDIQTFVPSNTQAAYNRISANIVIPSAATTVRLQVAAADAPTGNCEDASYTFVGPDGTDTTYYEATGSTIAGAIPFSDDSSGFENPARCFRYRAYLSTTDATLTPQLTDVTVSFSP